jgi:dTDP-4-amino-4,6-dideoxygalactose transaminase
MPRTQFLKSQFLFTLYLPMKKKSLVTTVKYIPFLHIHPGIKKEIAQEFERFYDEQHYIMGEGLEAFEKAYADFNNVKHSIGVGNGHDALFIILKCLNIGSGDEVILPAHTFIATALSVVNAGATPVLADIDENTFNIDPEDVIRKITKKTRAVVPVHLYGNPADMIEIQSVAHEHQLHIIEDNAQAQGAMVDGRKTGSMGVMNFTSFYPTKNIGALGDGGMITTDDILLAEKARAIRNYGKTKDGQFSLIGINSRLDELQARMLMVKLQYLEKWNKERTAIAQMFEAHLENVGDIRFQTSYQNSMNVRHIFPICTAQRDKLKSFLKLKGVDTLIHYEKPIHLHPSFSFLDQKPGSLPKSETICQQELSLPIYPGMRKKDIFYVCEQIREFFANH